MKYYLPLLLLCGTSFALTPQQARTDATSTLRDMGAAPFDCRKIVKLPDIQCGAMGHAEFTMTRNALERYMANKGYRFCMENWTFAGNGYGGAFCKGSMQYSIGVHFTPAELSFNGQSILATYTNKQ